MRKLLALTTIVFPLVAQTADVRGSQDHPVLTRYPGSVIQAYSQQEFDQYPLALGVENNKPAKVETIEGRVTKIRYVNPKGRSAFEIYKNYEQALSGAGFKTLWTCAAQACGYTAHWHALNGLTVSGSVADIRYLAARGKVNDQIVTITSAVGGTHTTIHIVEAKEMDAGLVTASAAELAEGLERDGHISVYAIYFDTGSAALKPESKPALDEIAKLMQSRDSLRLMIVGHTDSTGSMQANMKLSADRAASVVRALTGTYGIAASRLSSHGVGTLAPVATNKTEAGKAKNRRVDLVEQ
jgi:outer membrane protein OmpA-like peptidoglycan-associated protein